MFYIGLYLLAIVFANLTTALIGPGMSVVNALLFIGLDLTSRDHLHDAWRRNGLVWKMGLLIGTGSVLTCLLALVLPSGMPREQVIRVAAASFVAFSCAGVADTLMYHLLFERGKGRWARINGSNVVSAAVDSLVFPTLAFGGLMPWVTLGQFGAKVFGGFIWLIVLDAIKKKWALGFVR